MIKTCEYLGEVSSYSGLKHFLLLSRPVEKVHVPDHFLLVFGSSGVWGWLPPLQKNMNWYTGELLRFAFYFISVLDIEDYIYVLIHWVLFLT